MPLPDSTLVGLETGAQERPSTWGRRVVLALLSVLVLAGAAGLLGVRTETTSAGAGVWHLGVEHATVARAGLDVPWNVTVEHAGGFGKTITLAVTADYLDIYETQGFHPEPSSSVRDADTLYLTFDSPPGDTFTLAYDAYIQPASQQGRDATVSVIDRGVPVASVHITTHLLP
jgi:hypothetical protein